MAEAGGFEPPFAESKSAVLPLNDAPTKLAVPTGIEPVLLA